MPRILEILISFFLVLIFLILIFIIYLILLFNNDSKIIFTQVRIGQHGIPFTIYKLKTMVDGKVTSTGKILRKTKIDELPQLINVIKGDMSFVGPRPDVPGYYDNLKGDDKKVLELKPGLTSLAAIKYRNEETLLSQQELPLKYNDEVIFPDKVKMNLEYLEKKSFLYDLKIIFLTIKSLFN